MSSHVISVNTNDKPENKFDLLISISTKKECLNHCELNSPSNHRATLTKSFHFAFRYYYYLRFNSLTQYKEYNYQCFDTKDRAIPHRDSHTDTFSITFPKETSRTKLIAFGDWGMSKEGDLSLNHLKKVNSEYDAVLFLGDMAYNLDVDEGRKGNKFLDYMKAVSSEIPFMLAVGNHEKDNHFEQYKKRFYMPNHEETKNLYYSYDVNDVHIVSLNSEVFFNRKAFNGKYRRAFIKWLRNDLRDNIDRPWKIAYMHRPYYCSLVDDRSRCFRQSEKMRQVLEPMMKEYGVDLFLTGHNHYYERTLPVYNMEVDRDSLSKGDSVYTNPKYPAYVTCGISGTDAFRPVDAYQPRFFSKNVSITIGLCTLEIKEGKLSFEFVDSKTGEVLDNFKIIKDV